MNDRALITIAILIGVSIACILVAVLVPQMKRVFWILGLSLALLEFGGITAGIVFTAVSHRHLTIRALCFFVMNAAASWEILKYLIFKIKGPGSDLVIHSH